MSIYVEAVGNLGANPVKKMVQVRGDEKPVVTLRVCISQRVPDGDGGYVEKDPIWRDVAIWKPGLGDRIMTHLRKGSRVFIRGTEQMNIYTDSDGVQREGHSITADYVAVDFLAVETISFSKRRREPDDVDSEDDDEAIPEAAD